MLLPFLQTPGSVVTSGVCHCQVSSSDPSVSKMKLTYRIVTVSKIQQET